MPRTPVKQILDFSSEVRSSMQSSMSDTSTTPFSLPASSGGVLLDDTSAQIEIDLPALSTVYDGKTVIVRATNGSNGFILDGNASETIDGAATYSVDGTTVIGVVIVARTSGPNAGWWIVSELPP